MKPIRVAAGQGFWGDWLKAPVNQVRRGQIDYLMLDYLAEVTMSILAKQKERNPQAGFARDFPELMGEILPDVVANNIKVLANAGGVNPEGCAQAVARQAERLGLKNQVKIAVVTGDDILPRLDELIAAGERLDNFDDGRPITEIRSRIRSANVYLGSAGLVDALRGGANVVITGRVADTALVLAPLRYEFGWSEEDYDLLAAGTVAGHIIECGAQASGGNFSGDWRAVKNLEDIGFPIVEVHSDGRFVVTKHGGTGGLVSLQTVKEQLVYEIGDPANYVVPDVIADFTTLKLSDEGPDRVGVSGVKGKPRPERYKASLSYASGYMAEGTMVYSWPDAYEKAVAADAIVRSRLRDLGLKLDAIHSEIIGVNACHGSLSRLIAADRHLADLAEVMLRIAVRGEDQAAVGRFTREVAPLVLGGPPSATGYAGGKREVRQVVAYWPALISRAAVSPQVSFR